MIRNLPGFLMGSELRRCFKVQRKSHWLRISPNRPKLHVRTDNANEPIKIPDKFRIIYFKIDMCIRTGLIK
jgi:hypothetical protein